MEEKVNVWMKFRNAVFFITFLLKSCDYLLFNYTEQNDRPFSTIVQSLTSFRITYVNRCAILVVYTYHIKLYI